MFRWINGRDPRQYGLDFGLWTRRVVSDLIERKFNIRLGVSAVGELLALAACQQSAPPATTSAPAKPAATAPQATADSVGIPECDDYLNKYQACVESKVPEAARGALKQSIDQTRAACA